MFMGGFGGILLVLALIGIGLFLWLKSREDKRSEKGEKRLSTWRLVVASVFGLLALFSGGCSLLFLGSMDGQYVDFPAILIIGGIPFAIAVLVLWLSLRRGNG